MRPRKRGCPHQRAPALFATRAFGEERPSWAPRPALKSKGRRLLRSFSAWVISSNFTKHPFRGWSNSSHWLSTAWPPFFFFFCPDAWFCSRRFGKIRARRVVKDRIVYAIKDRITLCRNGVRDSISSVPIKWSGFGLSWKLLHMVARKGIVFGMRKSFENFVYGASYSYPEKEKPMCN